MPSTFKRKDGPFFSSLEKSLQSLNVQRQAYHGKTFVGNHVHKLLKVEYRYTFVNHKCCCKQDSSIETICGNIEEVSLTSTTMQREVKSVTEKFREAFKLFGACHNGYNGGPMSDASIEQLRKYSVNYCTYLFL